MKKRILITLGITLLVVLPAFAQLTNADRTLFYTQTGKTVDPGRLFMYNEMNFFTKVGDFIGNLKPQSFKSVNYWLVAGNTAFTYGIAEHFDATLGIRVYQDTHYSNEYNLPDDIFLTFRAGDFAFGSGFFRGALLTSFRIPTGEKHNYPFTEFASGAFEFGFLSAVSFYLDPYFPDRSFSVHYNIGIWDHNEKGHVLYKYEHGYRDPQGVLHPKGEELFGTVNATELRMALAAVYPTDLFDFRLEMSGILYLQRPEPFVYSAEEWAYLSPSVRYRPAEWVSLDLGADIRMSPSVRQWTEPIIPDISARVDMPKNYPAWRIHLGANFSFQLGHKQQTAEDVYTKEKIKEKKDFFETVLREKEKSKSVQGEVESLRKLRKEAEKEIKDLKKILEEK